MAYIVIFTLMLGESPWRSSWSGASEQKVVFVGYHVRYNSAELRHLRKFSMVEFHRYWTSFLFTVIVTGLRYPSTCIPYNTCAFRRAVVHVDVYIVHKYIWSCAGGGLVTSVMILDIPPGAQLKVVEGTMERQCEYTDLRKRHRFFPLA